MLVLVMGASGVLGRALVPLLAAAGHEVRPASRHLNGVDLLTSDLAPHVDGCDAVIHAATAIPRQASAPGAWDLNTSLRIEGTRRLLVAARAAGVPRYVQQSIVMAYQDGGEAWLDESTPLDASPARRALVEPVRAMEEQVRAADLNWTILRGGVFAGPGTGQDDLLTGVRTGSVRLRCDGRYWLSPIHPTDMASACVAALDRARPKSTFNITAAPLRYAEYVDRLADLIDARHPARLPKSDAPCPASHRCTSALAAQQLSWQPRCSIWPHAN